MVVYFGHTFKQFNSLVTLRSLNINSQYHCSHCSVSILADNYKTSNNVRYIQTSQMKVQKTTPELIYIPQVIRWLRTKLKFRRLKNSWDPDFSEGAFIYGTTRAVCKVSHIIHENKPEQLKDLLTDNARKKLERDMNVRLTPMQKKIININPADIKILVPIEVNLKTRGSSKTCDVSLRSLALKWFEEHGTLKLVLVALQTEFTRDYSDGVVPEWTISIYDILECAMLSETPMVN